MSHELFRWALRSSWLGVLLILGSAAGWGAAAKPAWQQTWEKTLAAAKKEAPVVIYVAGYEAVLADFQRDFPEIKIAPVPIRGAEISRRLIAERRADKYIADVVMAGANGTTLVLHPAKALDPIKPALILPEVTDESKWFEGKHQYSDAEGQYVFNYNGSATYGGISYNTKLVDPKEFKSYWDLLNPKWKGKVVSRDIREPGPGGGTARFFFHHPDLGAPFMRKLYGEMDLTLFRDYRQGPDWLAAGKFALCFSCDTEKMEQQGLPVDMFGPRAFKEGGGLVQAFGTLGLMNRAPNPNGARVFINWLLSRRGQIALQKRMAKSESPTHSLRIDIPKDDVPPEYRRYDGVKYVDTGRPGMLDMKPLLDVVNEALKAAGKN